MELLTHVADALCQLFLNKHVDILGFHIDLELTRFDVLEDCEQLIAEGVSLLALDDTLLCEHLRVRDGARDILLEHPRIKADGAVELVSQFTGISGGTSRPHFSHIFSPNTRCLILSIKDA